MNVAVQVEFKADRKGHAGFGRAIFQPGLAPPTGIAIGDGWWVNGRNRSLSAFYAVEGDATSKKLPDPPAAIGAILAGFGKPKRTAQFVAPTIDAGGPAVPREIALISPILVKYRRDMKTLIERIGLPHDLPPAAEARQTSFGASGPLKPALVEAFTSRGYSCRGGSGTFTLRRRTPANHVVEVELDVGTWSRSLTFMFRVRGPGFNATLMPPVTTGDQAPQYPIGDTGNWTKIVANLAAPFLEDYLISRNFSRPWVELHRIVVDEDSDVLELALSRHTRKLRTEILQGLEDLGRRLCHTQRS